MLNLLYGWDLRQHLLDGRLDDGLVALALSPVQNLLAFLVLRAHPRLELEFPARPVVGLARDVPRPADACRFLSS